MEGAPTARVCHGSGHYDSAANGPLSQSPCERWLLDLAEARGAATIATMATSTRHSSVATTTYVHHSLLGVPTPRTLPRPAREAHLGAAAEIEVRESGETV